VNMDVSKCINGKCNHTFEPTSNPPSSYDSVSVTAENEVGVGVARICTTQPISELLLKSFIVYRYYSYCTLFLVSLCE